MTVGIDLSPLQGAHRMRGIGYTLLNIINSISLEDRQKNRFVFYAYIGEGEVDPLQNINTDDMDFEVRPLKHRQRVQKKLPGRLNLLVSAANQLIELRDLRMGDSRIQNIKGVDFFIQADQSQHLPKSRRGLKKGLIIYDIIPYVLEWEYLWSYKTARRHSFSRKAALRVSIRRWLYAHKIKINARRANKLFAISEHTKHDFSQYLNISSNKILVTPLGINLPPEKVVKKSVLERYQPSGWGYMKQPYSFDNETPFMLYVGGADKRRKLADLVSAFNALRGQGYNFKLVLAGDSMQGPDNIATEEVQYALKTSSYLDDIIFMGFVDDQTRDWLYHNALVFIFPSRYEGFGLPVLEAMSYGTPVISYNNAATHEVAGDCPIYVNTMVELTNAMRNFLSYNKSQLHKLQDKNIAQAKQWRWGKTSQQIFQNLDS